MRAFCWKMVKCLRMFQKLILESALVTDRGRARLDRRKAPELGIFGNETQKYENKLVETK